MSAIDPDDFEALEELWNLPSPGDKPHGHASEKERRNAMYEYCYAKRDHLEHRELGGDHLASPARHHLAKLRRT